MSQNPNNLFGSAALSSEQNIIFPEGETIIKEDVYYEVQNLVFLKGAKIVIREGVTVRICGEISAGLYEIFIIPEVDEGKKPGRVIFEKITNVYPQWFGADDTGKNDSTRAFELAIESIRTHGGGLDCIGTFLCAGIKPYAGKARLVWYVINVPSNIRIFSSSTCLFTGLPKNEATRDYALFEVSNGDQHVTFDNLTFDGGENNANSTKGLGIAVVIRVLDTKPVAARNIMVHNCSGTNLTFNFVYWQFVVPREVLLFVLDNLTVKNCYVKNIGRGQAIGGSRGQRINVIGNYIEKTGLITRGRLAIDISGGCMEAIVADNIIINTGGGIKVEASDGVSDRAIIKGNICIGGDNSNRFGCRVVGNRVIVSDNIFQHWRGTGIQISIAFADQHGNIFQSGDNIIVANNIVEDIEPVQTNFELPLNGGTQNPILLGAPFYIRSNEFPDNPDFPRKNAIFIRNNIFSNCRFYGAIAASGVTFEGNTFKEIVNGAIWVANDFNDFPSPGKATSFDNLIIRNNKFERIPAYPMVINRNPNVNPVKGSRNVVISGNHFVECAGIGRIDHGEQINVSSNIYSYSGERSPFIHLWISHVTKLNVSDNMIDNLTPNQENTGIAIEHSRAFVAGQNVISGCAVALRTANTGEKGLVSNNIGYNSRKGFHLDEKTSAANNL